MGDEDAVGRLRGCLLAGAAGDALGANLEFDDLAAIRRRFGPAGLTAADGYPSGQWPAGAVTDDTQMTLFTGEGLLRALVRGREKGIVHPPTMLWHAYLRWLHTQGVAWEAMAATPVGRDGWLLAEPRLYAPLNGSKGCGGVMRAAPAAVAGLLRGQALPDAATAARAELGTHAGHEEVAAAVDAAARVAATGWPLSPETIEGLGGGWVAEEALAIALACALAAPDLHAGLLAAVNHGGDSDSTAAIAGNLLGAAMGAAAVPAELPVRRRRLAPAGSRVPGLTMV